MIDNLQGTIDNLGSTRACGAGSRKLSRCKRCGAEPVFDREKNEVRCPNGHFRFVAPAGKDVREVWESVQKSIKDERHWGQPAKLSRQQRQERFDARREAAFRRKVFEELQDEERSIYE